VKKFIAIFAFLFLVSGLVYVRFSDRQTPLAEIPQSERCKEMCKRRDDGLLPGLKGKSKEEVRKILGEPQNTDVESDVWIWLFDWEGYRERGLALDWKTMAANSPKSGLWIRFDGGRCAFNFPYGMSAWDPLEGIREAESPLGQ